MNVDELKRRLGLEPLAGEGGWFAETYRSPQVLPPGALGAHWPGPRAGDLNVADFEPGRREPLAAAYPDFRDWIEALCR